MPAVRLMLGRRLQQSLPATEPCAPEPAGPAPPDEHLQPAADRPAAQPRPAGPAREPVPPAGQQLSVQSAMMPQTPCAGEKRWKVQGLQAMPWRRRPQLGPRLMMLALGAARLAALTCIAAENCCSAAAWWSASCWAWPACSCCTCACTPWDHSCHRALAPSWRATLTAWCISCSCCV